MTPIRRPRPSERGQATYSQGAHAWKWEPDARSGVERRRRQGTPKDRRASLAAVPEPASTSRTRELLDYIGSLPDPEWRAFVILLVFLSACFGSLVTLLVLMVTR